MTGEDIAKPDLMGEWLTKNVERGEWVDHGHPTGDVLLSVHAAHFSLSRDDAVRFAKYILKLMEAEDSDAVP